MKMIGFNEWKLAGVEFGGFWVEIRFRKELENILMFQEMTQWLVGDEDKKICKGEVTNDCVATTTTWFAKTSRNYEACGFLETMRHVACEMSSDHSRQSVQIA